MTQYLVTRRRLSLVFTLPEGRRYSSSLLAMSEMGQQINKGEIIREEREYITLVNRDGLQKPSDILFITCLHAWTLYTHILGNTNTSKMLLFVTILDLYLLEFFYVS